MPPDLLFELDLRQRDYRFVAGIDEAGRGPLAGPVVAAAVVLDKGRVPDGIDDSKKLDEAARERLFDAIMASAVVGIGLCDHEEIDRLNILQATLLAMRRAVDALPAPPDHALVDGNIAPILPCGVTTVVSGDARAISIAAASIIAKVTRDRMMVGYCAQYPGYGFSRHKGYGTAMHRDALTRLGPCTIHRLSFAPVRVVGTQHVVDESNKSLIQK